MAYIGLAKPTIAKRTAAKQYTGAFKCGKAMETSITPNKAEGELWGDNMAAETDSEFTYADIVIKTTTLPIEAHENMFGHTVSKSPEDGGTSEVVFKATDEPGYVGYGFYVTKKVDGVRNYEAAFLPKCKFTDPADAYKTKGNAIEYQTPTINGKAYAEDDGVWKYVRQFATESEAQAWIDKMCAQAVV